MTGRTILPPSVLVVLSALPLPWPPGDPTAAAWCRGLGRPFGLDFIGTIGTTVCFLAPCPCCCVAWVPVLPDGTEWGYRLAVEHGCNYRRGPDHDSCDPAEIARWAMIRRGDIPPRQAVPVSDAGRRYTRGAMFKAGEAVLGDADPAARILIEARNLGSLAAGTGSDCGPILATLGRVAAAAGLPPEILGELHDAVLAGSANPRHWQPR